MISACAPTTFVSRLLRSSWTSTSCPIEAAVGDFFGHQDARHVPILICCVPISLAFERFVKHSDARHGEQSFDELS